jgi:hypothetical protein
LIFAATRFGGRSWDHATENRALPLTTDERLMALSEAVIAAFDKIDGGIHPGFRPAHAKGILLTGMFTPASEAASLARAASAARFNAGDGPLLELRRNSDGCR